MKITTLTFIECHPSLLLAFICVPMNWFCQSSFKSTSSMRYNVGSPRAPWTPFSTVDRLWLPYFFLGKISQFWDTLFRFRYTWIDSPKHLFSKSIFRELSTSISTVQDEVKNDSKCEHFSSGRKSSKQQEQLHNDVISNKINFIFL